MYIFIQAILYIFKLAFLNKGFREKKNQLIQQHQWSYLDIGEIKKERNNFWYLLFIDNKLFLFNSIFESYKTKINEISLEDSHSKFYPFYIYINDHRFSLTTDQHENIREYQEKFPSYETLTLGRLNIHKHNLLSNQKVKLMLKNFLHQYERETFLNPTLFDIYEDDWFSKIFDREKKIQYSTTIEWRNQCESKYQKILDILFQWKILKEKEIPNEQGYMILTLALKEIAIPYYSQEFEDLYKGYFFHIQSFDLDNYIQTYYTIDFINHTERNIKGLFTYYLKYNGVLKHSLYEGFQEVEEKINLFEKNKELKMFEFSLLNTPTVSMYSNGYDNLTIDDIDLMSGREFEEFIYHLFKKMGYTVNLTPTTGDQGIDLVAVKNGLRIGIQTKCYSNSVSNKAIQEVVAGITHYNLSKAIVITNNYFTKSAIDLALSNEVVLWDRNILKEKLNEIQILN